VTLRPLRRLGQRAPRLSRGAGAEGDSRVPRPALPTLPPVPSLVRCRCRCLLCLLPQRLCHRHCHPLLDVLGAGGAIAARAPRRRAAAVALLTMGAPAEAPPPPPTAELKPRPAGGGKRDDVDAPVRRGVDVPGGGDGGGGAGGPTAGTCCISAGLVTDCHGCAVVMLLSGFSCIAPTAGRFGACAPVLRESVFCGLSLMLTV